MENKCACGCGGVITNGKWKFLRGHKPKGELVVTPPDEEQAGDDEPLRFDLTLTVSEAQIDVLWRRLAPLEKANAIVGALQASLDATAEATKGLQD